uniref:Uncharacterized protein n=1 Tax=Rhizophora mucronata TaxID=61149 RepID=A0A2P2PS83_RHIMU
MVAGFVIDVCYLGFLRCCA